MIRVRDALGEPVALDAPARRVVSLVPSVTETLFALGCGPRVVGCTRFCIHPGVSVAPLPKVGGTKDPDVLAIVALAPDLVLANREENREEDVRALRGSLTVHVSYPRDLASLAAYLADLGALLDAAPAARAMIDGIDRARRSYELPPRPLRALYLIWREPWMAAGADTFVDALLRECGFDNVARDLPGRYPAIDLATFRDRGLDVVLLSSEPFPFADRHRPEVASACRLPLARVVLVPGEAFSWFGCRTAGVFAEAARVRSSWTAPA